MVANFRAVLLSSLCALGIGANASAEISGDVIRIGFLSDLSGPYADADGPGSAEAIRMAIADVGGSINGKPIEFVFADHFNKSDVASEKAREWFDRHGVDMLVSGGSSGATIALAKLAEEKKRVYVAVGTTAIRLTNEDCTPYTVHYVYDVVALARGTGSAVVNNGGKSWYFLTADYTFGTTLENIASEVVKENGGTVLGSARAPLNTMDFSSFILQAQNSNAQVLGLANGGGDTVNAITAASQFGLTRQMSLAGLLIHISDIHSLGLDVAQGMYATIGWYWDQDEASRKWSKRFFERMKVAPTAAHAGSYSAAMHYLNAVKALGTDDPDQVMAHMKSTPINDMFTRNGNIRPDGRMVYDMYLMQVKSPDESRYPWDYFKKIDRISGASIYTTKEESKCALWK